jgi:TnpA family transposase
MTSSPSLKMGSVNKRNFDSQTSSKSALSILNVYVGFAELMMDVGGGL